jgi:hypothetical protein
VEAKEEALGALFKTDVRFVVPRFQRRYVWTLDNWAALWSDVLGAVDRYTDPLDVPKHFLGAVVLLSGHVGGASTMRIRQVIDGQQRLATLQVLFAAARHVAAARGVGARYLTALRKLTHNDDEMSREDDDVYKLWPTSHDSEAFRTVMVGEMAGPGRDEAPLVQAYRYFHRVVRAWAGPLSGDALDAAFDRLLAVLNHGLHVVVLDLTERDNPQVVFESLNGRGMPLQVSDLVRNHLFYLADAGGFDADRLYEEHWARFEDGYWRDDIGKGPRGGTRLDAYLAYFLTMELRKHINEQQLFLEFRSYVAPQAKRLPRVMRRFAAYGDIYRALDQRTELDPYEAEVLWHVDVLNTSAVTPLLLYLFGEYDGPVRRDVLRLVDSYLVRRVVVGLEAKAYGDVAVQLLRCLDGASDPAAAVREQLAGYRGRGAGWPTDAELTRHVLTRSLAQTQATRIKLLLSIVDARLRTPMTEKVEYDINELTVEHLMPKSWNQHWPLGATTAEERRSLVYTLGNLTLVTGDLNGRLGNDPWDVKRATLEAHSRLNLNHGLPRVWDDDAIRARGADFARLLAQALPGPDAATTGPAPSLDSDTEELDPESLELDSLDDTEGETLAEQMEAGDIEVDDGPPAAPPAPATDDPVNRHVVEVLGKHPQGTRLTPRQIARTRSSVFPQTGPGFKVIADRLRHGTLSGVEPTTNRSGHQAARLSRRQPNPEPLAEATTILRAPVDDARTARFHFEMVRLHARARDEAGYSASTFLQQVREQGGLAVAKRRLATDAVSAGFKKLHELGRLDLSIEALVLHDEFAPLFTERELARARERLDRHGPA